jgi:hypothetical protein
MTVSLIVGTLRTLAEYTRDPAEILLDLNRRLLGRSQSGFAICLVLRINAKRGSYAGQRRTPRALPRWAGAERARTLAAGAILRSHL